MWLETLSSRRRGRHVGVGLSACFVVMMLLHGPSAVAQEAPFVRLSEADVRGLANQALVDAQGRSDLIGATFTHRFQQAFNQGFDQRVMAIGSDALAVVLIGPTGQYLDAFAEAVRKMEPHDAIAWEPGMRIEMWRQKLDARDIGRVVVQRNGLTIAPTSNLLLRREMTTPMGAKAVVHGAAVYYPLAAFDPGATVVLTVIPVTGARTVKTFTDGELRRIQ